MLASVIATATFETVMNFMLKEWREEVVGSSLWNDPFRRSYSTATKRLYCMSREHL